MIHPCNCRVVIPRTVEPVLGVCQDMGRARFLFSRLGLCYRACYHCGSIGACEAWRWRSTWGAVAAIPGAWAASRVCARLPASDWDFSRSTATARHPFPLPHCHYVTAVGMRFLRLCVRFVGWCFVGSTSQVGVPGDGSGMCLSAFGRALSQ